MEKGRKDLLKKVFDDARIGGGYWSSVIQYLDKVGERGNENRNMTDHCLRVADLAVRFGVATENVSIRPNLLAWSGLLHTAGKGSVRKHIFAKHSVSASDYKEIQEEVERDLQRFPDLHQWVPHIIVRHQRYGGEFQPKIPLLREAIAMHEEVINLHARLISLAVHYDSLRWQTDRSRDPVQPISRRERYLNDNYDQRDLLLKLEKQKVITLQDQ